MKKVWITYAWADNTSGDVDYLAQELTQLDFVPKLDKWTIGAGKRLWEQIDSFISNPEESDAWLFFATQNSLGSQPCREEYAYALDRVLRSRSETFPLIALFPGPIDSDLLPAGIRTRLYVSLTDKNWKERIASAVQGRSLNILLEPVSPFECKIHQITNAPFKYVVELRPRAGVWSPCFVAVPTEEVEKTRYMTPVLARLGPRGQIPKSLTFSGASIRPSPDSKYFLCELEEESTPTRSLFAYFTELPTHVVFGDSRENGPQFKIALDAKY